MLRTEAEARLRRMIAVESRPALPEGTVEDLLDAHGRDTTVPPVVVWEGSLAAAAAQGWREKAGLVVADFDFSADGGRYDKGQVYAHCLEMAQHYAQQTAGSGNGGLGLDPVGLVVNG